MLKIFKTDLAKLRAQQLKKKTQILYNLFSKTRKIRKSITK